MAAYNCELRQNTGSAFADIIYLKTTPAMVDGLLAATGKINESLLPASVFGSMRFAGAITTGMKLNDANPTGTIYELMTAFITTNGGTMAGVYWIATADVSITSYSDGVSTHWMWDFTPEEGETPNQDNYSITLEKGDRLICTRTAVVSGYGSVVFFSVINETYRLASGVVDGLMSSAHYTKLEGIAANANNYSHPTQSAIDGNATDDGISVIDRVQVNTLGHVTAVSTRNLAAATTSTPGHMSAADKTKLDGIATGANNYEHPTGGANVNISASTIETIATVAVNSLGHTTSFTKQTIRSASTSQTGLVELATNEEMKAGSSATLVGTAASVKAAIDFFATLPVYASLTAANTDAPNQPTGKLALVIV